MITYEKTRSDNLDYLYRQYDENLSFQSHFHDSFEFIYVFEGEIQITIGDKTYTLHKKEGLLILPNQVHSYQSQRHSKTFIIIFASGYIYQYYKTALAYCSIDPILNLEEQEDLILDLQEAEDNYLLKSRFYYLVYLYNKTKLEKRTDDIGTITQRLLAYIEENYKRKISLKTISRDLGYNYNYLSTLFNQRMQTNFQDFLNEYRINRFCLLLKEDHKTPIHELATEVGYTSLRSFHRNFRHYKKTTPKEYRLNLTKELEEKKPH